MRSPFFGEFMGTLIMILLGDGVVAGVLLRRSKAENGGWLVVTTGWCFAVMAGIFTSLLCGSPDAHLNPAITLAAGIETGNFAKLLPYTVAQVLGAFVAGILVWVQYLPHWRETPDPVVKRAVFCTSPAISSPLANVGSEVIATFVLVFVIGAISSKLVLSTGAAAGLSPYLVSAVVWGIGLSLGGPTGYAINPARDLGPRLSHFVLPIPGKGSSDWGYAPIPIIGPAIGAVAAGLFLRALGA